MFQSLRCIIIMPPNSHPSNPNSQNLRNNSPTMTSPSPHAPTPYSQNPTSSNPIKSLPSHTSSSIHASFHIPHIASIIQQLLENAIDARASSIHITTTHKCLDEISMHDDGTGIPKSSRAILCTPNATSKLRAVSWNDIQSHGYGAQYGFRGEALHCIAKLSEKLVILTRTAEDSIGEELTFDSNGVLVYSQAKSCNVGTTVTVHKPFHPYPVRRKHLESRLQQQFKDAVELVRKYAFICEKVRFHWVAHESSKAVFIKQKSKTGLKGSIAQMLGKALTDELYEEVYICDAPGEETLLEAIETISTHNRFNVLRETDERMRQSMRVRIHAFFLNEPPKSHPGRTTKNQLIFVNRRPVQHPATQRKIREYYTRNGIAKDAFAFVHYEVESDAVDANASTDKMFVFLKSNDDVVERLERLLHHAVIETKQRRVPGGGAGAGASSAATQPSINPVDYASPGGRFLNSSGGNGIVNGAESGTPNTSVLSTPQPSGSRASLSSLSTNSLTTPSSSAPPSSAQISLRSLHLTPSTNTRTPQQELHSPAPSANLFGSSLSSSPASLTQTPATRERRTHIAPTNNLPPRDPQVEGNRFARFQSVKQTAINPFDQRQKKTVRYVNPRDENGLFLPKAKRSTEEDDIEAERVLTDAATANVGINSSVTGDATTGSSTADATFCTATEVLHRQNTLDRFLAPTTQNPQPTNPISADTHITPDIQRDIERWKKSDSRKRKREDVPNLTQDSPPKSTQGSPRQLTPTESQPHQHPSQAYARFWPPQFYSLPPLPDINVNFLESDLYYHDQRLRGYSTTNFLLEHDTSHTEASPPLEITQQNFIDNDVEFIGELHNSASKKLALLLFTHVQQKKKYVLLMDCLHSQQKILFDNMLGSWKLDREIEEITPIALSSIEALRENPRLHDALVDPKYEQILNWNGFHVTQLDKRTQSTQHADEFYLVGKVPSTTIERYTTDDLVQLAERIAWFKEVVLPTLRAIAGRMNRTEGTNIEEEQLILGALRSIRPDAVRSYIAQRTQMYAEQRMSPLNVAQGVKKLLDDLANMQHEVQQLLQTKPSLNKMDKHFKVIAVLREEEDDGDVEVMKDEQ